LRPLPHLSPGAETLRLLVEFQSEVDGASSFEERVLLADRLFKSRNCEADPAFAEVRGLLATMCCGVLRCHYCEGSACNQIDHFRPKSWFPESVFDWFNFVYACHGCNHRKLNGFAIYRNDTGARYDLPKRRNADAAPPPAGMDVAINPRRENPFAFLDLDIAETFHFVPCPNLGQHPRERARYTCALIGLNERGLPEARRAAFENYVLHFKHYGGSSDPEVRARIQRTISTSNHRTVWLEMKRQRASYPELDALFAAAPEALDW